MGEVVSYRRRARGQAADMAGREAEARAADALKREGWVVLAQRMRTPAGEIDLIVERDGVAAMVEVKSRPTLRDAAHALQPRQQHRLVAAAEIALASNPAWGRNGIRFDVMLVDRVGQVRRIKDAFRAAA